MFCSMHLVLLLASCCSQKRMQTETPTKALHTSDPFSCFNATRTDWVGGVIGSGSGTEYEFQCVIQTEQNLHFDSVWVEHRILKPHIRTKKKTVSRTPVSYAANDTIVVSIQIYHPYNQSPKAKIKKPMLEDAEAYILYSLNNQQQCFPVKKITRLETIYRQ